MTPRQQEILDKIRKLQAHADSAADIGNEAEAQAFAAKVQELLTAYKLSMADVRHTAGHVEEPINLQLVTWHDLQLEERKIPVAWTEILARMVSEAYYCEFVAARGKANKVNSPTGGRIGYFAGAETDRKIAVHMFITLARFLDREATRCYDAMWKDFKRAGEDVRGLRGFRKGWVQGFLVRLKERFDEEIKLKANATPADARQCTAIVLVKRDALARVERWLEDNLDTDEGQAPGMPDGSEFGAEAGRLAADALDLKQKAIETRAGGPRKLR